MTNRTRQLAFAAAGLMLVVGVGCFPPDGTPETGPDTHSTPDADGVDGSGEVSDGDLTLTMGRSSDDRESYDPYPDEGAEIRLIHGFQGGYHVEPALHVAGIEAREFSTTIRYSVERIEDGEKLNRRNTYNIGQYGWMDHQGGHLHHSNPVVFETRMPDQLLGDAVRMTVTVDIDDGGRVSDTQTGTLVDGGRP